MENMELLNRHKLPLWLSILGMMAAVEGGVVTLQLPLPDFKTNLLLLPQSNDRTQVWAATQRSMIGFTGEKSSESSAIPKVP